MPMSTALIVVIVALVALLCGICGTLAGVAMHRLHERLAGMHGRIDNLEAEVAAIKSKRQTQSTTAALEDAMSVALDIIMQDQAEDEYRKARVGQLQRILQVSRTGPYAYPVDRAAGPRPSNGGKKHDRT